LQPGLAVREKWVSREGAGMCGIVGLMLKNPEIESRLGGLVVPMLDVLSSRGPDSTGVAVYAADAPDGTTKYSLSAGSAEPDWPALADGLRDRLGEDVELRQRGRDAVVVTKASAAALLESLRELAPMARLVGVGHFVEVYKDVGPALEVCERYAVPAMAGYQAVGHTRMATESAVSTEHSHPFVAGSDLALVHNGTFSNYASIRRRLAAGGVRFNTDNDSEVAARFVAAEMERGLDLPDALRRVLSVFDGFYTLLVATANAIAVVRDSFACKPMVVAETEDYVAVGSEYIALADLPLIEKAEVFEPMPEEIYTWQN
jgi:methylamine---glutamate N-methyltransferase subunit A